LGDLIALAVRLTDAGLGDHWDDVDACTRNCLVEQQLVRRDLIERCVKSFHGPYIEPMGTDVPLQIIWGDEIIDRSIGIYGGTSLPTSVPTVWSMGCCTGNGTQGLYYAWEGIVRESGDTAQVNLFLNRAARLVDVDSHLPFEGKVVIKNKAARRVAVRIPAWVNRADLRAEVSGKSAALDWVGRYVMFEGLKPNDVVTILFPVRETTASYTANANTPSEQPYSCTFRGSTLVDISPRDESPTSYPFYLRDHLRRDKAPMKTVTRFVADRIITGW